MLFYLTGELTGREWPPDSLANSDNQDLEPPQLRCCWCECKMVESPHKELGDFLESVYTWPRNELPAIALGEGSHLSL